MNTRVPHGPITWLCPLALLTGCGAESAYLEAPEVPGALGNVGVLLAHGNTCPLQPLSGSSTPKALARPRTGFVFAALSKSARHMLGWLEIKVNP